jgi:G3E family GTPase
MSERIGAFLLTGFLGSGKTTLLQSVLQDSAFKDTAVIVNEFGKVGLDHDLISFSTESTVVMPGGCVCCTIREDIETSLRELFELRDSGRIPAFNRIVIETTGIAEPVPILLTLKANPLAQSRLEQPCVITVVDGVLGVETLKNFPEATAQVASADIVVISKTDIAEQRNVEHARKIVRDLNPWTDVSEVNLLEGGLTKLFRSARRDVNLKNELSPDALAAITAATQAGSRDRSARRHQGVVSHSLALDEPLDWTAFGVWMTMLLHRHGANVLRVKGLLAVDGLPGPTLFQSSQHLVHPPVHMDAWPSEDRRSRLVFIVRNIDLDLIDASLKAFDGAARRAVPKRSDNRPAGSGGVIAGRPVRRPTTPAWIRG